MDAVPYRPKRNLTVITLDDPAILSGHGDSDVVEALRRHRGRLGGAESWIGVVRGAGVVRQERWLTAGRCR
ncbi:hypothetical protein GCM10009744_12820 [Kribbella alba]|uniref:Uncharacterized protein n=1 Tax=Kribbella alba TaxID=190197 RepID=A0ABP4QWX3_9ACTN